MKYRVEITRPLPNRVLSYMEVDLTPAEVKLVASLIQLHKDDDPSKPVMALRAL